jgi:NAD(P)-dependent dehydrogenase (short-subunit alcohol dehydrogenase family)
MTSLFSLDGKTALVTGGNQGLGKAFALGLAQAGARVAISGRREEANLSAAAEAKKAGFDLVAITADITDDSQISAMTDQAMSAFDGRIDILVNNAGICYHADAFDVTDQQWAEVFDLNVRALWKTSLAVGASMRDRRSGSIINIGSMSGIIVNRPQWQPAYNASKAAVHHLTKSLAVEWAPYGIRVNAVAPGYVKPRWPPLTGRSSSATGSRIAPSNASRSPRRSPPASSSSPATPHPSSPARFLWPTVATPQSEPEL